MADGMTDKKGQAVHPSEDALKAEREAIKTLANISDEKREARTAEISEQIKRARSNRGVNAPETTSAKQ